MSEKYIVLHTAVGGGTAKPTGFVRGDVIDGSLLEITALNAGKRETIISGAEVIQRYLGLGAIRPATHEEAKHEHVKLPLEVRKDASQEERLASQEMRLRQLTAERDQLQREVQMLRAVREPLAAIPQKDATETAANLLKAKEQLINDQAARLKELEAALGKAKK